jgi:NAD(P)-dependent dehydrogenase (short-subunit alcohol dehydrogenase family)
MSEPALRGKVALVTGAGSSIGLGRAMSLALAGAGARVAMMDVDAAALEKSVADAEQAGGRGAAIAVVGDVANPGDAARAVREAVAGLGGLHILVNNAGINPRVAHFWDLDPDDWVRTIGVNLTGPFVMARAVTGHLRAQGWGRIIGITTSLDTMLHSVPYGPAKAGHEALVAFMARDLDGSGVTANVLLPGRAVDTNMIPRDRDLSGLLKPEIMQAPVVWLASEASNGFNGRRIIAEFWDESLPVEQRLAKVSAPAAWPGLGRPEGVGGRI